ncbi:hypothetical protein KAR91_16200 [Candidatus Pacearchaeota archaeon]|nr:hypothetical protein [Candidatus Pacearchaeota archaeon]
MTIAYHVIKIEDFDADSKKTIKLLDELGKYDWDLFMIDFRLNEKTGKQDALCIFKK